MGAASLASAEPPPGPGVAPPPPDTGAVASGSPGVATTPDGRTLTVTATNETQLPVAPLTTATSSRDYLAGGTFTGKIEGSGSTELDGGKMVVGYQIGCGITLDKVFLQGDVGLGGIDLFPTPELFQDEIEVGLDIGGSFAVNLSPGEVEDVEVVKKKFKGTTTRVTLKDVHITIDGCVGQSFLRSFVILTSSTTDTDDIVAYYGVTKTV
nr:MspA family porin [Mycolicibacterium novocastrense]